MCLAVIALDVHPRYAVVIAANRDEFHARPTERAHWWRDGAGHSLLAGRDLEQGGTWLGVTRGGRWAFVTNVREPGRHDAHARSRGWLVPAALHDEGDVYRAVETIVGDAVAYNGFNLVAGEKAAAAFGSNRAHGVQRLDAGFHGVSNARLNTAWPKLARAKAGLADWTTHGGEDPQALFEVLADRSPAPDDELPNTGIPRDRERLLSSPFIASPDYGTRSSTVLAITRDGSGRFIERTFNAAGENIGDVEFGFSAAAGAFARA